MKKTIKAALIIGVIMIGQTTFAQKKPEAQAAKDTVKSIPKADTVLISSKIAYFKIEGDDRVFSVAQLKKSIVTMNGEDVDQLVLQIQEYPAKFANPFTQWLLRFFGLQQPNQQGSPPNKQ